VRLFDNVEMPLLIEGATREMGLVRIDHEWSGRTADSDGGSPDGAGPA
jgi:hypothetical protein